MWPRQSVTMDMMKEADDAETRLSRCEKKALLQEELLENQNKQLRFQQLADISAKPPTDPLHHVVFSPGHKDRVKLTKSRHRGHPCRYWHELTVERALPIYHYYLDRTSGGVF